MRAKFETKLALVPLVFAVMFSIVVSPILADSKLPANVEEDIITEVEQEFTDSEIDSELEGLEGFQEDPSIPEISGEIVEEEGLVVDLNFGDASEFRVVVGNECKVVEKVTIKTTEAVQGKLKVRSMSENTTGTNLDKSLGFCEFELVDVDNEKVEEITWKLVANRTELSEKDFEKDSIELNVLEEGKWVTKDTDRVDGDSDNFIYKATSSNFGDGTVALVSAKSSLFSARNILYCIGSLVGLALLLIVGYSLIDKSEK